jgi:hypothetical protein
MNNETNKHRNEYIDKVTSNLLGVLSCLVDNVCTDCSVAGIVGPVISAWLLLGFKNRVCGTFNE